ncbi:MAG TPA: hypothetical protein DF729_08125 [Hafnia paralvei]|uniref:DUF6453 family protein n=1 Tax=Hafnia paralvei TaxID=546367 RepID=UPI000EC90042|nr:DUF6453 family protein [Hafnia paralvei]HCU15159.1 hypothetical protein [Hafnia paralvei]
MAYGLNVKNPNTGKMFNVADVANGMMSFVTKLEFNLDYTDASSMTFNVLSGVPASSQIVLIYNVSTAAIIAPSPYVGVDFVSTTGFSRSGDNLILNFNTKLNAPGSQQAKLSISVYQITAFPKNTDAYGIAFFGGASPQAITDTTKLGYVRANAVRSIAANATINVSDIAGSGDAVFGWWSNPSAVVEMNHADKTISSTAATTLYLTAFGEVSNLTLPKYGLAIWNKSGRLVYSSAHIPFSKVTTKNIGTGTVDTGVDKPMIPLGRCGYDAINNGLWTIPIRGFTINGRNVGSGRSARNQYTSLNTGGATPNIANYPLSCPILDATLYHNV